jgi:prepilin peptidase CpaA
MQEMHDVVAAGPIPIAVVLVAALIAAVTDVWQFRVHNLLTLPLLVSGFIYQSVTQGTAGLAGSLCGFLFGFGALIVLYMIGGMGAGDVKFMAAIGAWLGMPLTLYVFLASSLAAGCYSVGLILIYGRAREVWLNLRLVGYRLMVIGRHLGSDDQLVTEVHRPDRRRRLVPFTAMVAIGLFVMLVLAWMARTP